MKTQHKISAIVGAIIASTIATGVYAQGGTAKPPTKNGTSPYITPTLADPATWSPGVLDATGKPANLHGFDVTGFIQDLSATTVTVDNVVYTIPSNLIVQMPANTVTWPEFVASITPLTLQQQAFPSFQIQLIGNTVGTQQIVALVYASQQSLNSGSGFISKIDYSTGNIQVDSGVKDAAGKSIPVIIQINDPNGRFGRAQSPNPLFSVDDENPTIHAGTGYPMCVPRDKDPTNTPYPLDAQGIPQDPLCPQKNRPKQPCRTFGQSFTSSTSPSFGTLPVSGDLSGALNSAGYCTQFVMKPVAGSKGIINNNDTNLIAGATDPDPRQQAPFEVGDFITWSGTLFVDTAGTITGTAGATMISAHTIEANVGIFTQPFTQPSYLSIGEFGVGTADPALTATNGAAQETQNRMFMEISTTDVATPMHFYMMDSSPNLTQGNRHITPFEMTGECDPLVQPMPAKCFNSSGGITTQFAGAQPQRARLRATKAPSGLLSQPSRTIRAMVASQCAPVFGTVDTTGHSSALETCLAAVTPVANGLIPGQYFAPVFEYIFPENVKPGDPIVPNDFWHLPMIVNGDADALPLSPKPW